MKVGGVSAIKINEFILYCDQLALPLPIAIFFGAIGVKGRLW